MIFNFELMIRFLAIIIVLTTFYAKELPSQQSLKGRFGFGFGFLSGIEFKNFEPLNRNFLKDNEKGLNNNLILKGFSGYFYFLILPDTRISMNLFFAEKETQFSNGRYLNYQQSFWNFGFEYTISVYNFNISPGIMFGRITDFVELINYDGSNNFSNIIVNFNQLSHSSSSIDFENISFHISPGICFEYSLSRFISARISYSYIIRLGENWKFLKRFPVYNFPDDVLKNNHLLNIGILIGFMSK